MLVSLIRKLIITVRSFILTTGAFPTNVFFREIDSRWGPFSVDCFASYANTKLPRFYSRFYSPNTLGVDALSHSCEGDTCHPSYCVTSVLARLWYLNDHLPFFGHALLMKIVLSVVIFLTYVIYVAEGKRVFVHCANKNCIFGSVNLVRLFFSHVLMELVKFKSLVCIFVWLTRIVNHTMLWSWICHGEHRVLVTWFTIVEDRLQSTLG